MTSLRAIHRPTDYEGKPMGEESVVIIKIFMPSEGIAATAIFVREDGTVSDDNITNFIITHGAWQEGE